MSARAISSLTDENRDLRKQIGCMNGIFQLFDRHHFLTGRRSSSHKHRRLLQDGQRRRDSQYTKVVTEKGPDMQKEKPRISTESSRPSYSSSSCSTSTFSSFDCNRTVQPEALPLGQINIPESTFHISAANEQQPSSAKSVQSLDLRDLVKDSMYREVRALSIKTLPTDGRRGSVMKHIDSPRPPLRSQSGKPKARGYEGSTRDLSKVEEGAKNSKEERLEFHRLSYDGRESRETVKAGMKHKELPRLSLDSKTSSIKRSALAERLNCLGQDQHMENNNSSQILPSSQEPGSHRRSSSVVAKLMGLEAFSDAVSSSESWTPTLKSFSKEDFLSQFTSTAEESKKTQGLHSPRVPQNNPASPSPRLSDTNSVRKPTMCSRFPMEPAPWRQQDCSQGSPRMASQSRKAPTNTPHQSSSVYGEIEKRITELEFKHSGKDLRALKQILEAMEKTRARMENQIGESAESTVQRRFSFEDSCSKQNSNLSAWKNRKGRAPINGPSTPGQLSSSAIAMKPATMMDKINFSISTRHPRVEISRLQRLQTQEPKHHRENSAHTRKAKDLTPKNNNLRDPSRHLPSTDKKTTRRTSEQDRASSGPQRMIVENCSASGRSSEMTSPRLQRNPLRMGLSHSNNPSSDSAGVKKYSNRRITEKGSQNGKHEAKAKDLQLRDNQSSEFSSETRYSCYQSDTASVKSEGNNSLVSHTETEIISPANSANKNAGQKENSMSTTRKHMPAGENVVTMVEQPSPISVLDDTFYCEDSPSPVKKTSTAFQDETPIPGEAECHFENPKHLTECRRFDQSCKYNLKLESMKHPIDEFSFMHSKPDETAVLHSALVDGSRNPDHRYITKILLTSGLLKDSSFITATDQLLPSNHLINPDMFHVIEQTEDNMDGLNGEIIDKTDKMKLNKKTRRKIIFDMVDEILVRRISSSRFTLGKKRTTPHELLKEMYLEIDRVCQISDCNLDNGEDETMYKSEDWVDNSSEVPALALDIERQIFKDLINEVITGEVMGLHGWPKKHCRQLFRK